MRIIFAYDDSIDLDFLAYDDIDLWLHPWPWPWIVKLR